MPMRASIALAFLALAVFAVAALPWPTGLGATAADPATGRALFAAKGCATCHVHVAIAGSGRISSGPGGPPAFTGTYPRDAAYLRSWLRDPQALKPTTTMPNLDLSEAEIAALIAFLQAGHTAPR